ncbi:MAG: phosphate acyltransferase PlsX [Candidatus Coatesbacteria bacterium]
MPTRIAVDAMGGDRAPQAVVEGALEAAREDGAEIILVGDRSAIEAEIARVTRGRPVEGVIIQHASEKIEMGESPAAAVKAKKDSSLVVAARLVREKQAAAVLSMGNTGACLAAALLVVGRLEGVQRPAIVVQLPHQEGMTTLLDGGANVDCRPQHLVQFAVMGEVYAELIHGVRSPRIGLLNVGEEDGKGTELTQEAHTLLRQAGLNYVGNIEGGDVLSGRVDVVVCDGFVGNILLKFAEGVAVAVREMLRGAYRKSGLIVNFGGVLSGPVFRAIKDRMDPAYYGGAPLLGVNGTFIVGHGSSSPRAVRNAISVARRFVDLKANALIRERLSTLALPKGGARSSGAGA